MIVSDVIGAKQQLEMRFILNHHVPCGWQVPEVARQKLFLLLPIHEGHFQWQRLVEKLMQVLADVVLLLCHNAVRSRWVQIWDCEIVNGI